MTLLEVILVLVLLALVIGYALPALTGTIHGTGLAESGERLRSLIHLTRAAAMRDGVRYRLKFPGAPDPDDPNAERIVETAVETQQPEIEKEKDPVNEPGVFEPADLRYGIDGILRSGVRCVAVRVGPPNFDVNQQSPFAGPEVNAREAPMDVVTFYPDGTSDWATWTLTSLPADTEPEESDIGLILNVMLDGRTGQTWFQRPWRNREVELMAEHGASPLLHVDFVRADEITEDNILYVHMEMRSESAVATGR